MKRPALGHLGLMSEPPTLFGTMSDTGVVCSRCPLTPFWPSQSRISQHTWSRRCAQARSLPKPPCPAHAGTRTESHFLAPCPTRTSATAFAAADASLSVHFWRRLSNYGKSVQFCDFDSCPTKAEGMPESSLLPAKSLNFFCSIRRFFFFPAPKAGQPVGPECSASLSDLNKFSIVATFNNNNNNNLRVVY